MKRMGYLAVVALSSVLSVSAFAQNAGGGGGDRGPGQGRGERGERGNREGGGDRMAEWRERRNTELKEQLGATDEEFKALQPKIERVQQLQLQATAGGFGGRGFGGRGFGGPGGGNREGGQQASNPTVQAAQELRAVLENKSATAADIKAKLDAFRAAKAKSREELVKAQNELKELLSQRQEAVLVQRGILD